MRSDRSEAYKLRVAGHSYNEIQQKLGIPKSTLSSWFKDMILSDAAKERLDSRKNEGSKILVKLNKLQTVKAKQRAAGNNIIGKNEISALTKNDLLLIGTALYWAEGYKRLKIKNGKEIMGHAIRFVNSDSDMVRLFIRFLKEVCEVKPEDIILTMRLYPHINEDYARAYWMSATGLPAKQFRKSTFLVSGASKGVRPFVRLPYGTLGIDVNNTAKFHRLMGNIEGMKKQT